MRKLLIVFLVCSAVLFCGCNGTIQTADERHRRMAVLTNIQLRTMVDDADWLMLTDRNSQCSLYHVDFGL